MRSQVIQPFTHSSLGLHPFQPRLLTHKWPYTTFFLMWTFHFQTRLWYRFQNTFSVYSSGINWELWLLIKSHRVYFQYQLFLLVFLVPIHHTSISTIWLKHWRSLHLEWKQVLCGNTSKIIREKKIQQYSYAIFLLTWHFTFLEGTRFLFHTNQRFLSLHDSHHIMNELIVLKKIKQCSFFFWIRTLIHIILFWGAVEDRSQDPLLITTVGTHIQL